MNLQGSYRRIHGNGPLRFIHPDNDKNPFALQLKRQKNLEVNHEENHPGTLPFRRLLFDRKRPEDGEHSLR